MHTKSKKQFFTNSSLQDLTVLHELTLIIHLQADLTEIRNSTKFNDSSQVNN